MSNIRFGGMLMAVGAVREPPLSRTPALQPKETVQITAIRTCLPAEGWI